MRPTLLRLASLVSLTLAPGAMLVRSAHAECTSPVLLDDPVPLLTGPTARFMVSADFNEDGVLDLAVSNGDLSPGSPNSSVAVRLGTGNRTYAGPVIYPVGAGACGLVAADFNEDGITDLAVTSLLAHTVSVLIGQGTAGVGNGTFAIPVTYPTWTGPFELVTADFNGDGILDLATSLNAVAAVSVLQGQGTGGVGDGTFGGFLIVPIGNRSTGLALGDFNGDAIADLAATENASGSVGVLTGTGSPIIGPGSFAPVVHHAAGPEPFHIAVSDFDENGIADLAVANTSSGGVHVLIGQPGVTFTDQATLPSGNSAGVAIGDLNEDGIADLVTGIITGSNGGTAEVFLGQGAGGVGDGTFGSRTDYASGGDVFQVLIRDLDADGKLDVLASQGYGSQVALLAGICAETQPDPRAPVITDVRDVPNDEGGKVFVTWTASSLDVPGGAVNSYRVWRRIPPGLAALVPAARLEAGEVLALQSSGHSSLIEYWEALATLPAQRLPGYGYTAATTQDSMPGSNPYTAFFVSALTANIDVFYSSVVDSGYSVDNIVPAPPAGLTGTPVASGFSLQWEPSPEADLDGYRLYRGPSEDFVPAAATLIATPTEPGWIDAGAHGAWFYKLSAVDVHENESGFSLLAPQSPVGVDTGPPVFRLDGTRPNPSRDGRLSVSFALDRAAGARLEVIDLAGRTVVSQDLGAWGPGPHVLPVGVEKPLASGIYFVRLTQEHRVLRAKAVVTR